MFGSGLGHVIRVRAHAVADDFGEDGRAAAAGVLQFFENHDARAFAHDKAVAIAVPGTAGAGWVVIAGGERAHGRESADAHRSDGGFGASGNHYVGIAMLDNAERIADGVRAGRASRSRSFVRAFGSEPHGNVPGSEVDDGGRNEERRNLARTAFEQRFVFALDHVESADARADVDAELSRRFPA